MLDQLFYMQVYVSVCNYKRKFYLYAILLSFKYSSHSYIYFIVSK